ncbi:hypothetical protein AKJ16_DCAP24973 [Drosera capensis]
MAVASTSSSSTCFAGICPRSGIAGGRCRRICPSSVSMRSREGRGHRRIECCAAALRSGVVRPLPEIDSDKSRKPTTANELDGWIRDSASEIVKNIRNSPFLVHIYPQEEIDGSHSTSLALSTSSIRLVFEEASPATWPIITSRWKDDNSTPSGVVLVSELGANDREDWSVDGNDDDDKCGNGSTTTRLWGLVVQGRGMSCPACYVLKTCQVQCCFGFCTHFWLSKADFSGKNIDSRVKNLLLRR